MLITFSFIHGDGTDFEALVDMRISVIANVVSSFERASTVTDVCASKEVTDFRVSCSGHLLVH
jgi:hypothetical protein